MRSSTPPQRVENSEFRCWTFINKPLFQRILFEVLLVVYAAVTNLAIPLTQQYLYYIMGKKYRPYIGNTTTLVNHTVTSKIEQETTLLVLYLNMAELFPTAVIVLVLGMYSDIKGDRRLLIWLPCLGNVVYGLGFLLPLYISHGDIDHPATKPLLYCTSVLYGLSGNIASFTVGISSYISDTDTVDRRSLRLSIWQMYYCFTYGISNYMSSKWLQSTGDYTIPFITFTVCSLLVFSMFFIFLNEPERSDTQQMSLKSTLDGIIGMKTLFRWDTARHKTMWCALIAFVFYCFVQQGQERTTVIFLKNEPLNWDEEHIGMFYLVTYLVAGVGLMPGIPFLWKYLCEASINILGMISFIIGSLMLAFAKTPVLIYLSSVARILHQIPWVCARSLSSKQAGEDEQGSIYAVMHFLQLLMLFLGTTAYNAMFFATIEWMNGFVFAISAVLLLPSTILLLYVKFITTVEQSYRSVSNDKASTETANLIDSNIKDESFGTVTKLQ